MRATHQVAHVVRIVFLARLLTPDDFGLFGIGVLVLTIVNGLSASGFRSAVIHHRDAPPREYLGVLWSVGLLRGAVLGMLVYASSGSVAIFFVEPQVEAVVKVLALMPLIGSLENPALVELERGVQLKGTAIPPMVSSVVDLAVSIPIAVVTGSVWALVWGHIGGQCAAVAASYAVRPWRPHMDFDRKKIRKLFQYGKWLTGGSALHLVYNNGDDLAVGKLLGSADLGLYRLAYSLSNMPADYITKLVGQVAFPAYSELQARPRQLREAYETTLLLVSSLAIPMAVGLCLLAPEGVEYFLGAKWIPMVPALQLLAGWGLIRAVGANSGPLYQAVGRPDVGTKIQFAKVVTLVPMLVVAFAYGGLTAVAAAIVLNALLVAPWNFRAQFRLSGSSPGRILGLLGPAILATVLMAGLIGVLKALGWSKGVGGVALVVAVGALFYFLVLAILDARSEQKIRSSLHRIFVT